MRNYNLVFFFIIFLVSVILGVWQQPIARDSEPGKIYFIGWNMNYEDTLEDYEEFFFYFSTDTGKTYEKSDFDGFTSGEIWLSTDIRNGVLYYYDGWNTRVSFDYADTYYYYCDDIVLLGGG